MAISRTELEALVTERLATDPAFRDALLADPRTALEALAGMPVPETVTITVHEESPADIHLVIPATALRDADLELVSGGWDGTKEYDRTNRSCTF